MESSSYIQVLIQGGAVGLALVAFGLLYKVLTNHNHHTNLVIKENAQANAELSKTLGAHTKVIEYLIQTIERKL
jgi:hypothetical protein